MNDARTKGVDEKFCSSAAKRSRSSRNLPEMWGYAKRLLPHPRPAAGIRRWQPAGAIFGQHWPSTSFTSGRLAGASIPDLLWTIIPQCWLY